MYATGSADAKSEAEDQYHYTSLWRHVRDVIEVYYVQAYKLLNLAPGLDNLFFEGSFIPCKRTNVEIVIDVAGVALIHPRPLLGRYRAEPQRLLPNFTRFETRSTMASPIGRHAVAAGEGAFKT